MYGHLIEWKMSTEGVNECPEDSLVKIEGLEKRQVKPTVKALALKIEGIQKERQTKIKKLKGLMNTINDLMENIKAIQSHLENCQALFKDATQLHNTVMPVLPQEEQTKQHTWFTKVQSPHPLGLHNMRMHLPCI